MITRRKEQKIKKVNIHEDNNIINNKQPFVMQKQNKTDTEYRHRRRQRQT